MHYLRMYICKVSQAISKLPPNFYDNGLYPFVKHLDIIEMREFIALLFSNDYRPPTLVGLCHEITLNLFKNIYHLTIKRHVMIDEENTVLQRLEKCLEIQHAISKLSCTRWLPFIRWNALLDEKSKFHFASRTLLTLLNKWCSLLIPVCRYIVQWKTGWKRRNILYTNNRENRKKLIQKVEKTLSMKGTNTLLDQLYTSSFLVRWLFERKTTSTERMQQNWEGIPTVIKEIKNREQLSKEIYWESDGPMFIHCHVIDRQKEFILLSSFP